MNKAIIAQRLEALRDVMRRESFGAFIFPTSDPHQSEYTADHWKGREWISGFNGSAGTAVVTLKSAALWTDSRYFIAAGQQLEGTEFQLMREKIDGTPTIAEWIESNMDSGFTEVAIDGSVWSATEAENLKLELRRHGGLTLRTNFDPLRLIWHDRPPIPLYPVYRQPLEYAGENRREKLNRIRRALRQEHADGMLMARLDDIAWALNLRGSDIEFCPLFVSFLLISSTEATLFIDGKKLPSDIKAELLADGVKTDEYNNVSKGLGQYFEQTILMDPNEVSLALINNGKLSNSKPQWAEVLRLPSPVPAMKAIKNDKEQEGFRKAMISEGVALVRFLMKLKEQLKTGAPLTEWTICQWIEELRSQDPHYQGPSFATIAAYGTNAAIVHYEPTSDCYSALQPKGFLLLDTGGQYDYGTTDITRTIPLGPLSEEECRAYTLVLKGHLRLQNTHFPDGAAGTQLDAIARSPLWANGLGYLHGTGHGVGSHLCVHEGPHQIRMEWKPAPLRAGMTVTDEPGVYIEGEYGVRIENTLLIKPDMPKHSNYTSQTFLSFEPLTLCPIDKTPIVSSMLNEEEKQWLNNYHALVYNTLSPFLNDTEQQWLRQQTLPLT